MQTIKFIQSLALALILVTSANITSTYLLNSVGIDNLISHAVLAIILFTFSFFVSK